MHTNANNTQENTNRSVAATTPQSQSGNEYFSEVQDNRTEAVEQRKLQEYIADSPRVHQLNAYQVSANNSPQVKQLMAVQAMADNYANNAVLPHRGGNFSNDTIQGNFSTIQKRETDKSVLDNQVSGIVVQRAVSYSNADVNSLFDECRKGSMILQSLFSKLNSDEAPVVFVRFFDQIPGKAMFTNNAKGDPGGTVLIQPLPSKLTPELVNEYTIALVHEFQHAIDYIFKPSFRNNHLAGDDLNNAPLEKKMLSQANRIKSEWNAHALQAAETKRQNSEHPAKDDDMFLIRSFETKELFMNPESKMFDVTRSYCIMYNLVDTKTFSSSDIDSFVMRFMQANEVDINASISLFKDNIQPKG